MSKPTTLERAVLQAIVEQLHSPQRESLAQQVANAAVIRRENTGAGFYTHFDVGEGPYSSLPTLTHIEVGAKVDGLSHGMGFIPWTKNGRLDFLEGYSCEESTIPINWDAVRFELVDLRKS